MASNLTKMSTSVVIAFGVLLFLVDHAAGMPRGTVNIYNEMDSAIQLHCQSRDNDLGQHTLWTGQSFGWGFHDNFFETTLFSCEFWSSTNQQTGFPVWSAKFRNTVNCWFCDWFVRADGFYAMEHGSAGPPTFVHPW